VLFLVVAGHETTMNGISAMLYYLATVPGLRERVAADRSLIPAVIDETLRIETPVIGLARTVMADTELAGQALSAGEKLLFVLNAANRDPAAFDRPDEFACPRADGSHLAFGHGIHRCAGEHLALLEMQIAAQEVLDLLPDYEIADGYEPEWVPGRLIRGMARLPAWPSGRPPAG
jgi:cytochrome P450